MPCGRTCSLEDSLTLTGCSHPHTPFVETGEKASNWETTSYSLPHLNQPCMSKHMESRLSLSNDINVPLLMPICIVKKNSELTQSLSLGISPRWKPTKPGGSLTSTELCAQKPVESMICSSLTLDATTISSPCTSLL